jgi:hypothetical protein
MDVKGDRMPRRVVTGRTPEGTSVFVSDEEVSGRSMSGSPDGYLLDLWGCDGRYQLPSDGSKPSYRTFFPPAEGFRYMVVKFQPDATPPPADLDPARVPEELEATFPGLLEHMELDHPGMHTTQTVDIGVVLSGEIWLELDDGAEVHLTEGDFVVQNGTRHAWRNKTDQPTTMAFVLVGADKSS